MYYNPVAKHNNCFLHVTRMPKPDAAGLFDIYHDDSRIVKNLRLINPAVQVLELEDNGLSFALSGSDVTSARAWVYRDCVTIRWMNLTAGVPLTFAFTPDAADIFEVRRLIAEMKRAIDVVHEEGGELTWHYDGADNVRRGGRLECAGQEGTPVFAVENGGYTVTLIPAETSALIRFKCGGTAQASSYEDLLAEYRTQTEDFDLSKLGCFAEAPWVRQAMTDMFILRGFAADGNVCYHAGTPWFACLFGRDSLITAEQCLHIAPSVARTTLHALGAFQAMDYDVRSDAEPGKIVHECRNSERCNLHEAPFGRYYGGIDTTLLYISLAAKYLRQTGDMVFVSELLPVIRGAIGWMRARLDDGDFITYSANKKDEGELGLDEKGWKDGAPVIHADGRPAPHPIALCEVQGYAYRALLDAASLAGTFPQMAVDADALLARAAKLKTAFNAEFWCPEIGTYALALDGKGEACRVVTTNPGHLLRTGIIEDEARIAGIAGTFEDPQKLFSGWGLRTLSYSDKSFDPDSYQLGGVWPHDTTECIRGLDATGHKDLARRLAAIMAELADKFEGRLPELIAGRPREGDEIIAYFNSCSPQAWAASIPFSLLNQIG